MRAARRGWTGRRIWRSASQSGGRRWSPACPGRSRAPRSAGPTLRLSSRIPRSSSWASRCAGHRAAHLSAQPIYYNGLMTLLCVGVGYGVGRLAGDFGWRAWHRKMLPQIEAKDRDFHAHVARWRGNPSSSSVNNPVPCVASRPSRADLEQRLVRASLVHSC